MRVGVLTTSYPRAPGDPAGNFVAGFARWLASQGAAVEVVAAGPGDALVDGIPVARVDGAGLFFDGGAPDALARSRASWPAAASFTARLALVAMQHARRWDALVSHWLVPSALVGLAIGARRHLAIAHSSDVVLLRRSMAGRALVRAIARRADLVYAAPHLVLDGAPGRVVPMGIDVASVAGGDRARARARHGLDGAVALFLGRLVAVKGVDLLVDALPDGVTLVVAGAGPEAAALAARARARCIAAKFVGEVRGADKADLLAAADVVVVPSRRLADGREEGTPTVIFEAQAAGTPVVATRTGGIAAALHDGDDAILVEPDADALRGAIARILSHAGLRARLVDGGRRAAATRDWRAVGPVLAGGLLDA